MDLEPKPETKEGGILLGGTFDGQLLPPTPNLDHRRVEGNLKGVRKEGMMADELWEYWSFEWMANVGDMADEGGGTWSSRICCFVDGVRDRKDARRDVCLFCRNNCSRDRALGLCPRVDP